jgi:2-polyprenyl-3-methyl-5-hydroxy-6-metoxy-1,4-benzoquinol methylase
MYVSPRPTPAILRRFYETSETYAYWSSHVFPASEDARRERIFRPRAERLAELCSRLAPDAAELLEVGAGFGTFCDEARRTGRFSRVVAVEPAPDLAAACRARGVEVIEAPIEAAELDGQAFDVIASFEVIEHLFSPLDLVRRCATLLRPGGLLVLTCPNVKGFDVAVMGPASDTVDHEHLNYFHAASLSHLAGRAGLETVETSTPGKLDLELVRKKALDGGLELADQPFVRTLALERFDEVGDAFQRFLAEHGLSSHMWFVARRPA